MKLNLQHELSHTCNIKELITLSQFSAIYKNLIFQCTKLRIMTFFRTEEEIGVDNLRDEELLDRKNEEESSNFIYV